MRSVRVSSVRVVTVRRTGAGSTAGRLRTNVMRIPAASSRRHRPAVGHDPPIASSMIWPVRAIPAEAHLRRSGRSVVDELEEAYVGAERLGRDSQSVYADAKRFRGA